MSEDEKEDDNNEEMIAATNKVVISEEIFKKELEAQGCDFFHQSSGETATRKRRAQKSVTQRADEHSIIGT
ncbi:unnamed protein product [Bathycoccus prasinos]